MSVKPVWTRLPNETSKAYEAFEIYRDMGHDRSIRNTGKGLAKNHKSLAKLSKKYEWVKRANAFDAYVGQRKAEAMANDSIEMHRRHAEAAKVYEKIALAPLIELQWRLENTDFLFYQSHYGLAPTAQLMERAPQFFKMYGDGADMERLARGFEDKGTEPNASTRDINSLISNPEFLRLIDDFIEQRPKGIVSPRQDEPEGERRKEGERLGETEKVPARSPILKRRLQPDHANSSRLENQQAEPRLLNGTDKKGEGI